jgi:outer membrane receptor protein involved in Fe transport
LTFDFKKDRGIYLNYSTGFSPPNITELYRGVKVPSLKPSTYINYEGGGWFAFSDKGYFDVSVYQMDGTNEIVSVKLPDGSTENQNAGKTQHKGIEASVKYSPIESLNIRAGGTYAEHKYINYIEMGIDYSGNIMSQAPQYIANAEITYKPKFIKGFRIALEWQGVGNYFMDAKNTQKYEGFNIFNARMGYTIKGFEIWANCINLTDAVYATTVEKSSFGTSYRPGQLRTINFGIGYTFSKKEKSL